MYTVKQSKTCPDKSSLIARSGYWSLTTQHGIIFGEHPEVLQVCEVWIKVLPRSLGNHLNPFLSRLRLNSKSTSLPNFFLLRGTLRTISTFILTSMSLKSADNFQNHDTSNIAAPYAAPTPEAIEPMATSNSIKLLTGNSHPELAKLVAKR